MFVLTKICSAQRFKNWKICDLQDIHTCNLRGIGSIDALDGGTVIYEGISLVPQAM
jgi:hypothetical protein